MTIEEFIQRVEDLSAAMKGTSDSVYSSLYRNTYTYLQNLGAGARDNYFYIFTHAKKHKEFDRLVLLSAVMVNYFYYPYKDLVNYFNGE